MKKRTQFFQVLTSDSILAIRNNRRQETVLIKNKQTNKQKKTNQNKPIKLGSKYRDIPP